MTTIWKTFQSFLPTLVLVLYNHDRHPFTNSHLRNINKLRTQKHNCTIKRVPLSEDPTNTTIARTSPDWLPESHQRSERRFSKYLLCRHASDHPFECYRCRSVVLSRCRMCTQVCDDDDDDDNNNRSRRWWCGPARLVQASPLYMTPSRRSLTQQRRLGERVDLKQHANVKVTSLEFLQPLMVVAHIGISSTRQMTWQCVESAFGWRQERKTSSMRHATERIARS